MWLFWVGAIALFMFKPENPWYYTWEALQAAWAASGFVSMVVLRWILATLVFVSPLFFATVPPMRRWIARHPLADGKFSFFIFALIPVQTLFTYNWFILPQYISRAFEGWIGRYFEIAANANPILIFIAVPIITAITMKANVYKMMIIGTFVMAAPTFLLVPSARTPWTLLGGYLLIMTIGEAMWQPRFLQYAAEIAPKGRTGQYMGVAQLPWFLTKVLVPLLYSGWMMDRYCPAEGEQNTEFMWFIFACIAMTSTVMLILAKRWAGKDFKTQGGLNAADRSPVGVRPVELHSTRPGPGTAAALRHLATRIASGDLTALPAHPDTSTGSAASVALAIRFCEPNVVTLTT